jgi:hypothetical protein
MCRGGLRPAISISLVRSAARVGKCSLPRGSGFRLGKDPSPFRHIFDGTVFLVAIPTRAAGFLGRMRQWRCRIGKPAAADAPEKLPATGC